MSDRANPDAPGPDRLPAPPQAGSPGLAGMRVLVCRARSEAGWLVDELRRRGAEPVLVPLVERADPADGGAGLRAAVEHLDRYQWVAATSAAGVRALLAAAAGRSLPPGIRIAAVGRATAAAFESAGITVDLVPSSATAADLAAAFPAALPLPVPAPAGAGGQRPSGVLDGAAVAAAAADRPRVLAPLAELAADDLVEGLTASGYQVDRVDAYRLTEPASVVVAPGGADVIAVTDGPDEDRQRSTGLGGAQAVLFTAPSVVDRFLDRFGPASVPSVIVCIGPRTADRATDRGLSSLIVAADHSDQGLIDALAAAPRPFC